MCAHTSSWLRPQQTGNENGCLNWKYWGGFVKKKRSAEWLKFVFISKWNQRQAENDIFVAVIGPQAYKLLKSLITSEKPDDKGCTNLMQALVQTSWFKRYIERQYRFNTRACRKEESVATYVSELHKLAQFCSFEDSLETMLKEPSRLWYILMMDVVCLPSYH